MQHLQKKTWIGILRDHLAEWRKDNRWSRETLTQEIVAVHEGTGQDKVTEIVFEPRRGDLYEHGRANADRFFRWLDDEGKTNALLPANFISSILLAMPVTLRARCLDALIRPLGFRAVALESDLSGSFQPIAHACALTKEASEAQVSLMQLDHDSSDEKVLKAIQELQDVEERTAAARRAAQALLDARKPS